MIWLDAVVGCLVWAGVVLLHDGLVERRRGQDLHERLAPFQPSVGDEAEQWLRTRG